VPLGVPSTTSVAVASGPEAGGILASTTGVMEASTWPRSSSSATTPAVGCTSLGSSPTVSVAMVAPAEVEVGEVLA